MKQTQELKKGKLKKGLNATLIKTITNKKKGNDNYLEALGIKIHESRNTRRMK